MQRRKTLINGISNSGILLKDEIQEILNEMKIDERVRGEALTINQFAEISNIISSRE
jgi:16S rRNA (adenine1518-N6/adenine1519-N6)-dimethyltransferase